MTLTPLQQQQPARKGPRVQGSSALSEDEALDVFDSESKLPRATLPAAPDVKPKFKLRIPIDAVLPFAFVGVVGLATGAAGMWLYQLVAAGRSPSTLKIETAVPGAEVTVGGKVVGRTPVDLTLAPGSYPVQLAGVGGRREFTVDLAAGALVTRHVEMPPSGASAPVSASGSLHVQTEPSRQTILVDGVERGLSPLTLTGLTPGEHQVAVRGQGTTVRKKVTIQANEKTVLVVSPIERASAAPPPARGGAGGWLTIASPIALTIREADKVIGTTDADRLMLPAGEHILALSNDALGFQAKRTVQIDAGKTAALKVDPPNGVLSINAQPWAEVWIDGQRVGETPIGNIARPIGQHEVVLRHPDLGERRETVTVTLRQPARLGVDMRKK